MHNEHAWEEQLPPEYKMAPQHVLWEGVLKQLVVSKSAGYVAVQPLQARLVPEPALYWPAVQPL